MKVQWVWTEPICLYNCVLPQRKLSYGVFNQIELPQRELTIFWGRCDMSTKQPTSATGIHCHLAGCSWITYPKDQTKAILRKLEVANHWKMVASLKLCYYQRRKRRDLLWVGKGGQVRRVSILTGTAGLLSWNISGKPEFWLTAHYLFRLLIHFYKTSPILRRRKISPSPTSHYFTWSRERSDETVVYE